MRATHRLSAIVFAVLTAAVLLWPAAAEAQRRGGSRGVRGTAVVAPRPASRAYYRPYYRPYLGIYHSPFFYSPFFYSPFYSPFGWYAYPWGPYSWGPYYPPYGWGVYDTTASVRVQVTPRDAEVYVDGYYAGVVDSFDGRFQRLRVLPGAHDITIYMAGYRSATERMYFRPHASYKISHALEKLGLGDPAEPKPQPSAQSSPVRDRTRDRDDDEFAPGQRSPEPRWPEPPNARPQPQPRAEVSPSATFGTLAIRVQPDGAAVVIDGERWQGPEAGERLTVQLSEGTHRVEIRKDGHVPYTTEVEVRAGDTTALNVSLPEERR